MSYVNLVPMIAMMLFVTVIPVPIVPIIGRPTVVAVVRIWPVIPVWVIAAAVAVRIISISVCWITNPDSNPSNADRYLGV
jgi:hypothetical protein